MRIATQLSYRSGFTDAAAQLRDLEEAGLDIVWVAEAYGFDGASLMGYIASVTNRIEIGSAILPIYTRTPTLLAMTAAGVDALSGGRCILGLGASGPQVVEGFHGVAYDKPLARTREIVEICRKVWARDAPVTHEGPLHPLPLPAGQGTGLGKPLKLIAHPERSRIPVFLAALGERNVSLCAEVAEGWLPFLFLPERAGAAFGPALEAGRRLRAEDLPPLEVAAGGLLCIGEPAETDAVLDRYARPTAALYIGGMGARGRNFYNALVQRYGFEAEAAEIQDLYLDGQKEEAAAKVPDELLRLTNLCGTEGFVRERIAAYREAGVTILNATPVGPEPVALVEKLRTWVDA